MGFFDRLKKGLSKTRENLTHNIERLIIGYADIDDDLIDELEETLLMADVGVKTTETLIAAVRKGIKQKEIRSPEDLIPFLEKEIVRILEEGDDTFRMAAQGPTVLLVVGTNGVGKTTTIGKLSAYYRRQGKAVLLRRRSTSWRFGGTARTRRWSNMRRALTPLRSYSTRCRRQRRAASTS